MTETASSLRPRAYSYIRMSTDLQLKGDSLRRQLEQSRRYADEHGLDLVEDDELHDIGVSAFKGANLTGGALGRFLEATRAGRIEHGSYLLVESLDRLSRQQVMTSLAVFMDIINNGVNIVTLSDRHLYQAGRTDFQQLIYSIVIMSRAHEESQMKSHRLSAAWENKRRNVSSRKLTARCPAWLQLSADRTQFLVVEERAAIVRSIFEECASGIGIYSIARRLNESGVKTFGSSRGWQISYVTKILNNRAVLGEFQPHRMVNGTRPVEGSPVPDYFPRVVDDDLFYRAQNARNQRRVGGGGRKGKFISNLFSGLAKCAYCESPMHFVNKGPGPKGGSYLVCDAGRRGLGCDRTSWRYESFEASFLGFVKELDLEPLLRGEQEAEERAALERTIHALKGRQRELEQLRDRTYELLSDTQLDTAFVASKLRTCSQELQAVEADLRAKEQTLGDMQSDVSRFYESKEQIKTLVAKLSQREDDETYRLRAQIAARLKGLISKLIVAPSGHAYSIGLDLPYITLDEDLRADLIERHSDPKNRRRYFMAVFKDGGTRAVYFSKDDPFSFEDQIFYSTAGITHIASDGLQTTIGPDNLPRVSFPALDTFVERSALLGDSGLEDT